MEKNEKKKGGKGQYWAAAAFSLVWLVLGQVVEITKSFDNKWSDLRLIFPMYLSIPFTPDGDYTFLFGKYVNKAPDEKITITAIDEYTVERYGFPFKRRYYGQVIDRLTALGVKAIGVDVMFFEPDRDDPSNDARFLDAVARAGNVVNLFAVDKASMKVKNPIPGLASRSAYMAYPNSDISLDSDGHARHFYLFYPGTDEDFDGIEEKLLKYGSLNMGRLKCSPKCDETRVASLGMATYAVATGKSLVEHEVRNGQDSLTLNYRYPSLRQAHPGWKKPSGEQINSTFRHISVADIIDGNLSKEEKDALKGGITLIGSTALGTYDHFPSPFSTLFPGVEIHATCMDNLKFQDSLRKINPAYLSLLILVLPWLAVYLRRFALNTVVIVSSSVMAFLLVADYVLLINLYAAPFMLVALAFAIPAGYIIVDKGLIEGREKKWIKNTFGQYLSPKVVDLITKDPSKLSLGGEKREMTAFFLDIAGFTTMSEKLAPEELTAMLTNYLSGLTDVVLRHDGTVDKFIGDCIMAFWNAPLDQADHRKRAVLAAVDCQAEMARLNETLTQYDIKPACRVGLNTGPMVVGNMGSKTRMSYTIMGDSVNLASRLEGANKFFHSKIMVSEYTFEGLQDQFDHRELGSIRVVGKAIPVKVYEPFARKGEAAADVKAMLAHYEAGLEKFRGQDFKAALKEFKAALAARPGDGPSQFYVETCEQFAKETPRDWDGAFTLTSKG